MAKRVKTPKRLSNSRSKKNSEDSENTIISLLAFAFLVLVIVLFFYFNGNILQNNDVVADIDGKEITRQELEFWYKVSVVPEKAYLVSKKEFLENSLIPQEIVLQKAREKNIKATQEDVEKLTGSFLIENGFTIDDFEKNLKLKGLTIDDIKRSFEARAVAVKFLEQENVTDVNKFIDNLTKQADIKIFAEKLNQLILKNFKETGDEVCMKDKPVIRLYTTSWCNSCNSSIVVFNNLIKGYFDDNKVTALEWSLDTGDNLLTLKKENGVPEEEVQIFKKYSPDSFVPALIMGCKYIMVGGFNYGNAQEFNDIMNNLTGG